MVTGLSPFEPYHLVTFGNRAGEDWLVGNAENCDNMLFCEGAHTTAVRSTNLILVDLGGLEASRRVGVDT